MSWLDMALSWWGIGGGIAGLLAIAWFIPPFRNLALAGIAALAASKFFEQRGAAKTREEWRRAEEEAIRRAEQARVDGERDAADPGVRDPYDRDNNKKPM